MTFPSESPNPGAAQSESAWHEVAGGVYRLVAQPDAVTIGLVVGSERALLIDCGSTPQQGRRLRESVATVTDRPLAGVVVTHEHRDHWFGLAAFDDLTSWGHELLAERIDQPAVVAEAEKLGLTRDDLRVPSATFSLAAAVDLGDRLVEIVHLGHAHSPTDAVVHVPDGPVLFAGDLIERPHPLMESESSPRGWPATLNMLMGMVRPETLVVPGHGEPSDSGLIVHQLGALSSLPSEAERLVHEGVPLADAETAGTWQLPWDRIKAGVATAYAELGALGVRRRLPLV